MALHTKVANPLGKPKKPKKTKAPSQKHSKTIEKTKKNKKTKDLSNYGGRGGAHVWASLSLIIACFFVFVVGTYKKHAIIRERLAQT